MNRSLLFTLLAMLLAILLVQPSWAQDGGPQTQGHGQRSRIIDLHTSPPADFAGAPEPSQVYSFCLVHIGCPGHRSDLAGSLQDSIRAMQFLQMTTKAGAEAQEMVFYAHQDAVTGATHLWAPRTRYRAGQQVRTSATLVYETRANCTSGPQEPGGQRPIPDGTCRWGYLGENTDGKTVIGASQYCGPASGNCWVAALNQVRAAGSDPGKGSFTLEVDTSLADAVDHAPGTSAGAAYGIIQGGYSSGIGTIGHSISTRNDTSFAWHYAFGCIGVFAAKDACFAASGSSADGFVANGANGSGGFRDQGIKPLGFYAAGTYSGAAFDTTLATAPVAYRMKADQSFCLKTTDFCLAYVSGGGVLSLTVSGTQPWFIDAIGRQYAQGFSVTGTGRFRGTLTSPASTDACNAGEFVDDANYHYVCVATNTWKRVALSTY